MNAIILAGGKATRLSGKNKALLKIGNQTFIEHEVRVLKPLFGRILVITKDEKPGLGPLMGLYTGLKESRARYNFVMGCDAPLIQPALIKYLMSQAKGFDAVVPRWEGRPQPLCAVYSRGCVKLIEKAFAEGALSVRSFYKYAKVRFIPKKEIVEYDAQGKSFFNVNTKADYKRLNSYL